MTDAGFGCNELRDKLAELAVGALEGGDRARAVAHLADCPTCRQEAAELTQVADDLLLLAPQTEPPPGFESRVLASLGAQRPVTQLPERRRWVGLRGIAAAAALIVAAVSGGVLARVTAGDDGPPQVRTAMALSASGRSTCRLVITGDDPASVVLTLDGQSGFSADYVVEAQPADGPARPLGRFSTTDGHGMMTATVDLPAAEIRSVRVFDTEGELLYEAFPSVPA